MEAQHPGDFLTPWPSLTSDLFLAISHLGRHGIRWPRDHDKRPGRQAPVGNLMKRRPIMSVGIIWAMVNLTHHVSWDHFGPWSISVSVWHFDVLATSHWSCTHSENRKISNSSPYLSRYFPWKLWNSNPKWSISTGDYEGWQTIQPVGPESVSRKLPHFQRSTGAVFSNGCMDWSERLRGWSLVWHSGVDVLGDFQLPCWSKTFGFRFNPLSCNFFVTSKFTVWLRFTAWFFQQNAAFLKDRCMPSIFEESPSRFDKSFHVMTADEKVWATNVLRLPFAEVDGFSMPRCYAKCAWKWGFTVKRRFSVKRRWEQGDWQISTKWKLGRIGVKSEEVI